MALEINSSSTTNYNSTIWEVFPSKDSTNFRVTYSLWPLKLQKDGFQSIFSNKAIASGSISSISGPKTLKQLKGAIKSTTGSSLDEGRKGVVNIEGLGIHSFENTHTLQNRNPE